MPERLLPDPDAWVACADGHLEALDRLVESEPARAKRVYDYDSSASEGKRRAGDLAEWHGTLLERLADYDAAKRLARLAAHPACEAGAKSLLFPGEAGLAGRQDGPGPRFGVRGNICGRPAIS